MHGDISLYKKKIPINLKLYIEENENTAFDIEYWTHIEIVFK